MSRPAIQWTDLTPTPGTPPLRGGSGIVYRASWRRTGAPPLPVAVKLLRAGLLPGSVSFEDVAGKVEAEAAAMTLAMEGDMGDNVARLCGVARGAPPQAWLEAIGAFAASVLTAGGTSGELLGLVMRWEEGGSLADLLHTPERAWGANTAARLQLCAQLAVGLCNLHAKGVVHADIKSGNVLLSDRSATPRPLFTDFGIAELRRAAASTTHTQQQEGSQRGTWCYMALEMFRSRAAAAAPASRATDVYALGTLCWEVLTGRQPWEGFTDADRRDALRSGEGLDMGSPPLPLDTPSAVMQMLALCMSVGREDRPKAEGVAAVLGAAVAELAAGEYDVFLSHAWVGGRRAPLTIEVYERLRDAGLKVWVDTDMGANFEVSMREGVARSKCVVALMSQWYSGRPNCLKELRYAKEQRKEVVGCFTEAGVGRTWWTTSALKGFIDPAVDNMPNLVLAANVDWEAQGGVPAAEREKLTRFDDALPKLLRLVRAAMVRTAVSAAPVGASLVLPVLAGGGSIFVPVAAHGQLAGGGGAAAQPAANAAVVHAAATARQTISAASLPSGQPAVEAATPAFVMPLDKDGDLDFGPVIVGPLKQWREANPGALVANLCSRRDLHDADFAHLRGIKALKMWGCTAITDAAFVHLTGIHTLYMGDCRAITDAAFVHLTGIHTLNIRNCKAITDAAFVHLTGIHTLDMGGCTAITDAAFVHLTGIHTLHMYCCDAITDAAFVHLTGIHTLYMQFCTGITDAAFAHLTGIHTLRMAYCATITDAAFVHLTGIHTLDMGGCTAITDAAFVHLTGIHTLDMEYCRAITDAAFVHLTGIHTLNIRNCKAITDAAFAHLTGIHSLGMRECKAITDAAFVHLTGIHTLGMGYCTTITDAAFVHLTGIHTLDMEGCNQPTITDAAFVHLTGIHTLDISGCNQPSITAKALAYLIGIHKLTLESFLGSCTDELIAAAKARKLPVCLEE